MRLRRESLNQTEVSRLERGLVHPTQGLGLVKFFALLRALGMDAGRVYRGDGARATLFFPRPGGGLGGSEPFGGPARLGGLSRLWHGLGRPRGNRTPKRRGDVYPQRKTQGQGRRPQERPRLPRQRRLHDLERGAARAKKHRAGRPRRHRHAPQAPSPATWWSPGGLPKKKWS